MGDGNKTLGQRIVEAARLATIAHLSQAQDPSAEPRPREPWVVVVRVAPHPQSLVGARGSGVGTGDLEHAAELRDPVEGLLRVDERVKRQTGEIVAGEETLGRQIPIGVEVRAGRGATPAGAYRDGA